MRIVINCVHIWSADLFLVKDNVPVRNLIKSIFQECSNLCSIFHLSGNVDANHATYLEVFFFGSCNQVTDTTLWMTELTRSSTPMLLRMQVTFEEYTFDLTFCTLFSIPILLASWEKKLVEEPVAHFVLQMTLILQRSRRQLIYILIGARRWPIGSLGGKTDAALGTCCEKCFLMDAAINMQGLHSEFRGEITITVQINRSVE